MPESLVVAFRPLRSCMVSLPSRWASALAAQPASRGCMVFKLSWGERLAYVAWSGGVSRASEHRPHRDRAGALSSGTLEIDGTFGSRLGLRDGDTVGVEYEPDVVTCTAAEVVPEHFDDWEILELNAGAVEGGLLAQVRAVAVGQPIVFWLNPSTAVTLSTASVTPKAQVCLLDNDTEVAVAPKVRRANLADSDDTAARSPDGNDGLSRICCLRMAAGEDIGFGTVYVSPESALASQVAKLTAGGAGDAVVRIGHAIAPRATRVSASSPEGDEDRWLSPWLARLGTSAAVQPGVLLASPSMLAAAGYAIGELVRAQGVAGGATTAVRPAVLSFSGMQLMVDSDDIRSALQCALEGTERRQLVLNVGSSIPGDDGRLLARLVSFQTPDSEEPTESAEVPLCLSEDVLADLEIRCIPKLPSLDADEGEQPAADLGGQSALAGVTGFLSEAWQRVDSALVGHGGGSGVLVCGRRGSGKTSIVRHLAQQAQQLQCGRLVYCRHVDCTQLSMEPRTSTVRDELRGIVQDILVHQPSLLIFDDLDSLLPAETEQGDSRRVRQLADAVVDALYVHDQRRVVVLATATGRAQVHARLFASGVFQCVLEIPAPGKAERELILAAVARRNATRADTHDVNFSVLSYLTEGYMPADLHGLYERAVHEATMRVLEHSTAASEGDVVVKHADLVRAHAGFKPVSLRGVQLQSSQTRWADIGGLEDTRRQLRETLELPTRYAAIFASSPLRLRSGVLLFGYPGCGKTLLASAIARECGLNFIATKGPELLSKYIGSSEQSVRDLFKRAVAASPCVLFFDEFESIAPRRGHDNTGVTDRVVNQFLTEMDGAEGLKGVYVLAATSRPDLIDPALLRPGRLDKSFLCGMPNTEDRRDILARQATKVNVSGEVDWLRIAQRTDGLTGAELQALLYNAFLEAVHEATASHQAASDNSDSDQKRAEFTVLPGLDQPLSAAERARLAERLLCMLGGTEAAAGAVGTEQAAATAPVVTAMHFERALQITQSSLSAQDRAKFEAIFRDFVDDKKGPRKPVEQRATLA